MFIGDAMPHTPEYILNREGLDWREPVRLLAVKGVSCHAVQRLRHIGDRMGSSAFWREFAAASGRQLLQLLQLLQLDQVGATVPADEVPADEVPEEGDCPRAGGGSGRSL